MAPLKMSISLFNQKSNKHISGKLSWSTGHRVNRFVLTKDGDTVRLQQKNPSIITGNGKMMVVQAIKCCRPSYDVVAAMVVIPPTSEWVDKATVFPVTVENEDITHYVSVILQHDTKSGFRVMDLNTKEDWYHVTSAFTHITNSVIQIQFKMGPRDIVQMWHTTGSFLVTQYGVKNQKEVVYAFSPAIAMTKCGHKTGTNRDIFQGGNVKPKTIKPLGPTQQPIQTTPSSLKTQPPAGSGSKDGTSSQGETKNPEASKNIRNKTLSSKDRTSLENEANLGGSRNLQNRTIGNRIEMMDKTEQQYEFKFSEITLSRSYLEDNKRKNNESMSYGGKGNARNSANNYLFLYLFMCVIVAGGVLGSCFAVFVKRHDENQQETPEDTRPKGDPEQKTFKWSRSETSVTTDAVGAESSVDG